MPPILGTVTPADPAAASSPSVSAAAPANQPVGVAMSGPTSISSTTTTAYGLIAQSSSASTIATMHESKTPNGATGTSVSNPSNTLSTSIMPSSGVSAKHHSHTAAIAGGVIGMLAVLFLASGIWFMWRRRGRRIAPSTWFMATGIRPKPGLVPVQSRFVRLDAGEDEDPPPAYERAFEEAAPTHAERGAIDEKSESRVSKE
ncbi:hypothetical protein EVJ58_g4972 [Rhodofomes roseus]|uniref:Uncharacterized protein n=1 Tax=Rhodofomes roseus TaxID=34475 RepID=A0A4Y9YES7_9APHY|nr:hypothetical protein EVJ58_g4972 [Rhodofomes roseus]